MKADGQEALNDIEDTHSQRSFASSFTRAANYEQDGLAYLA